ncbi:MAG: cadherin-like domain-containing protein [Betaproteobacteria bacterium]|nr:cadherin-like domain-containing protein [Betaproteobacteria bacterium]
MFMPSKVKTSVRAVALAFALGATSFSANAVLERVGPTNTAPSVGGFPSWYQDTTGLTLEFCDPKNQAEVDGGWCLLIAGDVSQVPEVFPNAYADEHFWFAADAIAPTANGAKALLVLGVEAAFATDRVIPGDQITFARIRVVLNPVPVSGTYRFIHPYGEETIDGVAGDRIFFTEDFGIGAPGEFAGALGGRFGPFLLPSDTPGGAELPATPGPSGLYIADPARSGPVTGSSLPNFIDSTGASRNHNIFRIEGPAGSGLGVDPITGASLDYVETTNFALMGRIMTTAIPGRVGVDRASYTRNASGQKVDVFATAFTTTQGRLPTQPKPGPAEPMLTFFDAPCAGAVDPLTGEVLPPFSAPAGATETQMFARGGIHWGQIQPAAIPQAICVKDGTVRDVTGNVVPFYFPKIVTDEVTITEALYDPSAGTLTVAASSSDSAVPPTLTLSDGSALTDLVNGQAVVSGMIAAPAKIRVSSIYLGANTFQVSTGFAGGTPTPAGIPVAANDSYTFLEDSGAQSLSVLANDSNATGGTITIASAPRLGTATVGTDGVVNYTPNLNASGTDVFTYTVTTGTQVSNTATVTLNITPVNDEPIAVDNTANAIVNQPVQINVLANDTDPDGTADLVAAVNVTQPTPAGFATTSVAGGVVTFNATAGGTYTFTYQAQDASGAVSANTATVTVQVAAAETISFTRAEYIVSKSRIKVQGTISPAANQTVKVEFVNSAGTVLGTAGTVVADAAGNWTLDTTVARPTGTSAVKATSSNGTVRSTALISK